MKQLLLILFTLGTCCAFSFYVNREKKAPPRKFPIDFDTAKFRIAQQNPEQTIMRMSMGTDLRPNGYFFGPPGIEPDGKVDIEAVRKLPYYTDGVTVYYRYLVKDTIAKTDTLFIRMGSKIECPLPPTSPRVGPLPNICRPHI